MKRETAYYMSECDTCQKVKSDYMKPGSWDKNLPWAEFSYNNSYQESLKMAPFKVLYERQCRTVLNCFEPGEKVTFGPDIVEEAEATVRRIQDNLRTMKSCQESYANKRCQP
jgi:hypothetical protein